MLGLKAAVALFVFGVAATGYWAIPGDGVNWPSGRAGLERLNEAMATARDEVAWFTAGVSAFSGAADTWLTRAESIAANARTNLSSSRAGVDLPEFRFEMVSRGNLVSTVAAIGSLDPVATVQVGTEVGGQIKEIYADYNDGVARGQPIALIDPVTFQIAVDQAKADLDVARASVEMQRSTIERMVAALETARFEHLAARANTEAARVMADEAAAEAGRKDALARTVSVAERERAHSARQATAAQLRSTEALEGAKQALVDLAEADLQAARSQLVNFEAVVRQREAVLRHAEIELERTVIRSPVNGVIIHRDIEVGQTVATGLSSPILFTIAQDLRDMQVKASVDESEIGHIAPGQRVEFTVDAYPGRRFSGVVEQIRKSARTVQNVVTYTVVVQAKNPDLLLLPGMTASARFIVAESRDAMTVPNAALRFRPPDVPAAAGQHVWVEERGGLHAIPVRIGLTDGTQTEISGEGIHDGLQVITGMERPRQEQSTAKRLIGIF